VSRISCCNSREWQASKAKKKRSFETELFLNTEGRRAERVELSEDQNVFSKGDPADAHLLHPEGQVEGKR
jgi:hypothetical protein